MNETQTTINNIGHEFLFALYVLAGIMICLGILHTIVFPRVRRLLHHPKSLLDETILDSLIGPAYLTIIIGGVYTAIVQFAYLENYLSAIDRWATVGFIIIGFIAFIRVFNILTTRYMKTIVEGPHRDSLPFIGALRKIASLTLLVLLLTTVLGQLGVRITPLLTSLGIVGLAMAIALQDTLGNLFAGFYILFDRPMKVGDYVKLENGEEGFVTDIGWRNTKIQLWANNVVIIPNSKLAGSIVTNHHLPEERQNVYITCGVSYDSDLEHVEQVCIQVGREIMERIEGADTEFEPVVRFNEFGDSNINFKLVLRIREFGVQYLLTHECIKALHKRFREQGIDISWPVRKLVYAASVPHAECSVSGDKHPIDLYSRQL